MEKTTQPLTPEQFRALKLTTENITLCENGEARTITVLVVDPSSLPADQPTVG